MWVISRSAIFVTSALVTVDRDSEREESALVITPQRRHLRWSGRGLFQQVAPKLTYESG